MNKKQLERRAYVRPEMRVCELQTEQLLTTLSGQAGTIEQGGTGGDAKRGFFDEDEENSITSSTEEINGYRLWEN